MKMCGSVYRLCVSLYNPSCLLMERMPRFWKLHTMFSLLLSIQAVWHKAHTHKSAPWTSALHRWLDATPLSPQKALSKVIIQDRKKRNMTGRRQMRLIKQEGKKGMKWRGKEGSKQSKQEGMKDIKAGWSFSCKLFIFLLLSLNLLIVNDVPPLYYLIHLVTW